MKITTDSSRHENGYRIVTQTITYTLSDDLITLGQLHNQLGHIVRRLEETAAMPPSDDTVRETERLNKERIRIEEEIVVQKANVEGYGSSVI